jgi:hypothetical protein
MSESAVDYAVRIIDAYQVEIRGRGLDEEGFCQGVIFRKAVGEVRELERAERKRLVDIERERAHWRYSYSTTFAELTTLREREIPLLLGLLEETERALGSANLRLIDSGRVALRAEEERKLYWECYRRAMAVYRWMRGNAQRDNRAVDLLREILPMAEDDPDGNLTEEGLELLRRVRDLVGPDT